MGLFFNIVLPLAGLLSYIKKKKKSSVLGPVLWSVYYIDDLLRQLPAAKAYANDCTIPLSYCRQDSQRTVTNINRQLNTTEEWGRAWHVTFASDKTHATVVSRSPAASQAMERQLKRHAISLLGEDEEIAASITALEHQRDVATLTVCHKAWVQHTPHLTRLSLPAATPTRENDEASRSRRPAGGRASLPLLTTPANLQRQGRESVEPLHGGHA
ncbi:hypothetical protein E2C01_071020 [Portunus trituberculatus]|uniref:Reverse transcriptase domain-containing protein n=1 Tax=Portunus trituberculatus TaxID=210409 RepID=A0A5B7I2X5_PORTR|nr:hypothetical protein [Portunus trituberculatus]